jgi:hypothetical protein
MFSGVADGRSESDDSAAAVLPPHATPVAIAANATGHGAYTLGGDALVFETRVGGCGHIEEPCRKDCEQPQRLRMRAVMTEGQMLELRRVVVESGVLTMPRPRPACAEALRHCRDASSYTLCVSVRDGEGGAGGAFQTRRVADAQGRSSIALPSPVFAVFEALEEAIRGAEVLEGPGAAAATPTGTTAATARGAGPARRLETRMMRKR